MPKKKDIKLKIIQNESEICRPSPYILDLKKVSLEKEKVLEEIKVQNSKNNFISVVKDLSFIYPIYFLSFLIFKLLKISSRLLGKFFISLGHFIKNAIVKLIRFIWWGGKICFKYTTILLKNGKKIKFHFSNSDWLRRFLIFPARQKAIISFLIVSFILVLPLQALSFYGRIENFLIKNKLDNFSLVDLLKLLPQKSTIEKAFFVSKTGRKILGYDGGKRYLVLFQNSAELRPTGGFIGSFALIDILNGKIRKMEIPPTGSYALQGWLTENVLAPAPLHLINPRWEFQDGNWFPDFPTSAQKLTWFYTKSGGPSVDGVIGITTNFFQNILEAVGPIELPSYGKVINSENFFWEIQRAVEIEYDKKENKPKQIIADLAPKIIDKILSSENSQFAKLVNILADALAKKDVLLYFKDKEIQNTILNFGWAGEIKDVRGDYLMVVDTNIAGAKTDAVILNQISHLAEISDDGSIIDTLTVTKIHQGAKGELFTGVRNVDYLRIYVPKGSLLLSAEGFESPAEEFFQKPGDYLTPDKDLARIEGEFEIDKESGTRINQEFGKTVFGNWVQVDPGQKKTVKFTYKLPFKVMPQNQFGILDNLGLIKEENVFYSLFIQKQPGTNAEIASQVKFPVNWQPIWKYPENLEIKDAAWMANDRLTTDHYYGVLFKIEK